MLSIFTISWGKLGKHGRKLSHNATLLSSHNPHVFSMLYYSGVPSGKVGGFFLAAYVPSFDKKHSIQLSLCRWIIFFDSWVNELENTVADTIFTSSSIWLHAKYLEGKDSESSEFCLWAPEYEMMMIMSMIVVLMIFFLLIDQWTLAHQYS